MISMTLSAPTLDAHLTNLIENLAPSKLLPGLAVELRRIITQHLLTHYVPKTNALGGQSSLRWKKAISSIETEIHPDTNSVTLKILERGITLQLCGGTAKSVCISEIYGKKIQKPALPAIAPAHGLNIAEAPELKIGTFPEGSGLGKAGQLSFRSARQPSHKGDAAIIPGTLETQLVAWIVNVVMPMD